MPVKALQSLIPLLDIKTEGRNPAVLGDEYQATIDALLFFLSERAEVVSVGSIVAAQGITAVVTVPDDEIWVALSLGAYESAPGTGVTGNRMMMTHTDGTGLHTIVNTDHTWRTSTADNAACSYSGPPIVLQAGSFIGVHNSAPSPNRNIVVTGYVKKIKI